MWNNKIPPVNRSLLGHYYQDLTGILRLIDVLEDKCEKVVFEKKDSRNDKFDDVKVFLKDTIHHYQIKYSYAIAQHELKSSNFTNQGIGLYFPDLVKSWEELCARFNDKRNILHIYTTKSISDTNLLVKYLIKIEDGRNTLSLKSDKVFKFSTKLLSHKQFAKFTQSFENNDEINKFFESLIIEVEQPCLCINSCRVEDGELYKIIQKKIERLGLLGPPFDKDFSVIFNEFFHFVNETSIISKDITKQHLIELLKLEEKFKIIKNTIEFNENEYVRTQTNIETLNKAVQQNSGKVVVIQGKPGSGKTWFLTKWLKEFKEKNPKTPPIWYYSSISVTRDDDSETRITKQQLLNNLIAVIQNDYGVSTKENLYGSTMDKLQELIDKLGLVATQQNTIIPIVIDGLDHISRIQSYSSTPSPSKETVLDVVQQIKIPNDVCLIFGSQKGTHLNFIKEKYGDSSFIELEGFTKNETRAYLQKISTPEVYISEKLDFVYERTSGLPLLANYLGKMLKQTGNSDQISNIPHTGGNVEKYYAYLWKQLDSPTQTRKFARNMALLEFASETSFLDKLIPKCDRDGESLSSCLEPLIFLLRENQEKEFSIFHDSFREFILRQTNFQEDLQHDYTEKIYSCLKEYDLMENEKSFRYWIRYAFKCEKYDEILSLVNLEFVDESIKNLNSRTDLENNIKYSIEAAYKLNHPEQIIIQGLLKRYTLERYQYLDNHNFNDLVLELFPEKIYRYLIFENKLNLSLKDTIWFLVKSIQMNIPIVFKEIFNAWHQTLKPTKKGQFKLRPDDISLPLYGFVLYYEAGISTLYDWIKANKISIDTIHEILEEILPLSTFEDLSPLYELEKCYKDWEIIDLQILYFYKKHDEFCTKFQDCLNNVDNKIHNIVDYIKYSHFSLEKLKQFSKTIDIEQPRYHKINIENILELEKQIAICSYSRDHEGLSLIKQKINKQEYNFFAIYLELLFNVTKIHVLDSKSIDENQIQILFSTLKKFANYESPDFWNERPSSDQPFPNMIKKLIRNACQIIIESNNATLKIKLVDLIPTFVHTYQFTHVSSLDMIEFVLQYSDDIKLQTYAMEKIPTNNDISYTQDMVDFYLKDSLLNFMTDKFTVAKQSFERAVDLSFSYGYHKDMLLDELRKLAELIDDGKFLERFKKILEFTEYMEKITDNDETGHIDTEAIVNIVSKFPFIGFKLGMHYGIDSYTFEEVLSAFARTCKKCPALVRYSLLKTRLHTSRSYEPEQGFQERIDIIDETIQSKNHFYAKLLLNDLSLELQRDFPEVNNKIIYAFNERAAPLNMSTLKTHDNGTERLDKQQYTDEDETGCSDLDEAFEKFIQDYGWSWGSEKRSQNILKQAYQKDPEKTNRFVIKSMTNRCVNNYYEPCGMIHIYGLFLSNTNQNDTLITFYESVEKFVSGLFRLRALSNTRDLEMLFSTENACDGKTTGFEFLMSRLNSLDTEIVKRSMSSIIFCLINNVDGLLDYCIEKFLNENSEQFLQEKLAAVLDIYVTNSKNPYEQIVKCAKAMITHPNRRIVNSGANILRNLGIKTE